MSENQDFEYQAVSDALESAAVATPAADCHGLLCGLILSLIHISEPTRLQV